MDPTSYTPKKPTPASCGFPYHGMREHSPMHPDDFDGLFAWITAKQQSGKIPESYGAEKYRFLQVMG